MISLAHKPKRLHQQVHEAKYEDLQAHSFGERDDEAQLHMIEVERRWNFVVFHGEQWIGREFGEGDGKKRENGEKEDEDEVEVKECEK